MLTPGSNELLRGSESIPLHVSKVLLSLHSRLETMEKELREMKRILGVQARGFVDNISHGTSSTSVADFGSAFQSDPSVAPETTSFLYFDVLLIGKSLEGVSIDAHTIRDLLERYSGQSSSFCSIANDPQILSEISPAISSFSPTRNFYSHL